MKKEIPLKRIEMEHWIYGSTRERLKRSAIQHGYSGFLSTFRFSVAKIKDYFLHLLAYFSPIPIMRVKCQRKRGVRVGKNVQIGLHVLLDTVFPNFIVIEDGAILSGSNFVLTHNTPPEHLAEDFSSFVAPVIIKKNAWVTIGAIILPGVTIGEGSVIATGSVVTEDVPPHTFVGGIPAKFIRRLSPKE